MLRLYIARVASIYRADCIYISDALYLYIQWRPYIVSFSIFSLRADKQSIIMLFDATEGNASLNYFIMAKLSDRIIVRTVDNSQYHRKIYKQFMGNKDIFYTFDRNLKGEHTKWQD